MPEYVRYLARENGKRLSHERETMNDKLRIRRVPLKVRSMNCESGSPAFLLPNSDFRLLNVPYHNPSPGEALSPSLAVILSPSSSVILSEAKDLYSGSRVNSAKNLSGCSRAGSAKGLRRRSEPALSPTKGRRLTVYQKWRGNR
jgi:hypothetical protein